MCEGQEANTTREEDKKVSKEQKRNANGWKSSTPFSLFPLGIFFVSSLLKFGLILSPYDNGLCLILTSYQVT